ncbi:hypothetical protein [Actinokineospora iranica]|uniref:Carboxypeptidase regulatory-like domain-containing protein n=1 Tax=Actinokineospora iranica TaxID=1271860 RepID=A0A1G6M8R8_9PSEU|nr:hypothetical protein [Actinokineospora iranica]SDC51821.1 hypothetical protein SAMN05216174_102425 [Actinokineospora iranica]
MTADGELDDLDWEILREIRGLCEALDPVPDDLVERVRFAIDLADIDTEIEVLRATEMPMAAGARGEHSRVITFDSPTLTIMVKIESNADGSLRVDGWLSPVGGHAVEARTASGPITTSSSADGRFSLARVPAGMVQFVVRPSGQTGIVSTPTMKL